MKTRISSKLVLLTFALSITVLAQLLTHFSTVGDLGAGAIHGLGIGLLLVAVYPRRRKMTA